ncbi:TetR/AcrR family transcriptional regulator [Pontibacter sp. G13]|uniref:TetR/AcrR family transcriptional regulator n=1 Tax=Pontibacter sp. G13 TaxID=3074898 RepID=UPI00288A8CED|nr:TetR/AcrR family transcriptional regulator [Pontibacter sp. G13]WNJ18431.1 TetR/AcrR family transcriptional regulator [Pontibacter sp. G13]
MAVKTKYDRASIIQAAVKLVEEQGHAKYSVRNVAQALNSSTQPIYSHFQDSHEVYEEVLAEIKRRLVAHTRIEYTEFIFRNIGFGFTIFARDYPNLFTAFFDDSGANREFVKEFLSDMRDALDLDERFHLVPAVEKDKLLNKMWTLSYGYTHLIIRGMVDDVSDEALQEFLLDAGTAIIKDTLTKAGLMHNEKPAFD